MPRLWTDTIESHRREVRDAVLDATASLVARHGLLSVTMSQIAADAGIGRATLYKYFPDVEAILHAWHGREIARHLDHLVAVRDGAGDDPLERLQTVLQAYAEQAFGSRRHHESELAALLHRSRHVATAELRIRGMVRALVREGVETGDIRSDVPLEELVSFGLSALAAASSLSSRAAVRRLVDLVLAGMAPSR